MNNLFLTLKAKKISFSYEHDGNGTVTKIKDITLQERGKMHFANGKRICKALFNELLKYI